MNNDFVSENYELIKRMSAKVCKSSTEVDDLAHEVCMHLLKGKLPEVIDNVPTFIYSLTWKHYNMDTYSYGQKYKGKYIYSDLDPRERIDYEVSIDQQYADLLNGLEEIDAAWLEQLKKRNMSINLLSQHSGICRERIKERIQDIKNKLND